MLEESYDIGMLATVYRCFQCLYTPAAHPSRFVPIAAKL